MAMNKVLADQIVRSLDLYFRGGQELNKLLQVYDNDIPRWLRHALCDFDGDRAGNHNQD